MSLSIPEKVYTLELEGYESNSEGTSSSFNHILKSVYVGPISAALNSSSPIMSRMDESYKVIWGNLP